ncbi:hypothetical protein [Rhodovulum marinum]|uniref:Uncharacterized protein n=1 Tax=Rhodovulum marinum TaxID=320662 RepID=A0A4R2PVY0_9RHOB|nr:hypothetical protein [Rhodovulum marinum]TCP40190.1 hypothetical protein EV662_10864 [Rhodovulum marinum]
MTDPTPPDFAPLRERGIRAAQDASGEVWTDYNLHDPGVTLLEQTCFALTEVGYRNAHPVRDLLTGPDDTLDHDAAGLFDPARMLPTAPVTEQDLAAAITRSDRIACAVVLRSGHKGLYEVRVIPEPDPNDPDPDAADAAALAEATRIFRENRPLCCDLDAVRVSRRRPVRLTGEVAITPTAAPERVVAEILYRVGALLRGQADPAGDDRKGPARRAVARLRPAAGRHAFTDDLPHARRTTAAGPAPPHRRIEVLDHLIALQGEEMPATRHTGLHHYRSRAERERAEIDRHITFLRALPDANFARSTAPHGTRAGGFLAKLALLADLRVAQGGDLAGPMAALGLALDPDACPPDPALDRADLPASGDPMALLMPRDPTAPPLVDEALLIASPFVAEGRIAPALFTRAADPAAYLVAPDGAGGHRVLFDPGTGQGLYPCGQLPRRAGADLLANRLRNGWRALHERCEGLYLVEDILLRARTQGFAPHVAALVLTGWTARTARPDFRAHVEALVARLSPAHVLIRPLWLGLDQMARLDRAAARLDARNVVREAQA